MDIPQFVKACGWDELEPIAIEAGTTLQYLRQLACGDRKPSWELTRKLEVASQGRLSRQKLRPDIWGDAA